jgi:hypothetical protein
LYCYHSIYLLTNYFEKYFQRLFILDTQIKHLDQQSLEGFGHWLRRRWYHCQDKKAAAEAELKQLGITEQQLRSEWAAQVAEQTKPAPRMFYFNLFTIFAFTYHGGV